MLIASNTLNMALSLAFHLSVYSPPYNPSPLKMFFMIEFLFSLNKNLSYVSPIL